MYVYISKAENHKTHKNKGPPRLKTNKPSPSPHSYYYTSLGMLSMSPSNTSLSHNNFGTENKQCLNDAVTPQSAVAKSTEGNIHLNKSPKFSHTDALVQPIV